MLRERVRNRLLRRADWRFLLPNPCPARSVCLAGGPLAKAVGLISSQVIPPDAAAGADCDLAVTVDPDELALRAAWDALAPGGICYSEWYAPLVGGAHRVRQRIEAAGFDNVTCYWSWPPPVLAPAQLWLPIEAVGATRYVLNTYPRGEQAVTRLARRIGPAVWPSVWRTGLLRPVCAVACKPASACAKPVEPLRSIVDNWAEWGLGRPPDQLSWLLLTGGPRTISKPVGLVFAEPDSRPRLAVKYSRVPEAGPKLQREADGLRATHALRPGGVPGVPRLLFNRERDGVRAVGETAVVGQLLYLRLRRDNYGELALRATDWLAHLAGRAEPQPPATWWDRLVGSVLDGFEAMFGGVVDPRAVARTRSILRGLGPLPLVIEQRDFSPWNVLVCPSGDLAVLDWESSEPRGLPLLDLLYLLGYLTFDLAHVSGSSARFAEAYRASLDPTSFSGRVRAECLERYLRLTGLDPAAVNPLRLLVWLVHTRSDYEHLVADYAGQPAAAALRASLFLTLWRAELDAVSRDGSCARA